MTFYTVQFVGFLLLMKVKRTATDNLTQGKTKREGLHNIKFIYVAEDVIAANQRLYLLCHIEMGFNTLFLKTESCSGKVQLLNKQIQMWV